MFSNSISIRCWKTPPNAVGNDLVSTLWNHSTTCRFDTIWSRVTTCRVDTKIVPTGLKGSLTTISCGIREIKTSAFLLFNNRELVYSICIYTILAALHCNEYRRGIVTEAETRTLNRTLLEMFTGPLWGVWTLFSIQKKSGKYHFNELETCIHSFLPSCIVMSRILFISLAYNISKRISKWEPII